MNRSLPQSLAVAVTLLALGASTSPLAAQSTVREGTIDPGMSRAQVEERLGRPKVVRSTGATSYLFYANGCARSCGMDDLVVLEEDAVTDAVFRSPAHRYTGQSSSPAAVAPRRASRVGRAASPPGVTPIRSDSAMAASGRGGLVIGGDTPAADSAAPSSASSTGRGATRRSRRLARARAASGTTAPAPKSGASTPVQNPVGRTDSSAAPVPFQGAQLAPADSDLRALRRAAVPAQSTPPAAARPDSTRP